MKIINYIDRVNAIRRYGLFHFNADLFALVMACRPEFEADQRRNIAVNAGIIAELSELVK